jgi:hypothetical protein
MSILTINYNRTVVDVPRVSDDDLVLQKEHL